jgi:excisionase family DNA binding protein
MSPNTDIRKARPTPREPDVLDRYYSASRRVEYAAEYGGPGRRQIYSAIKRGELPSIRPGSQRFLVKARDFFTWAERFTYKPANAGLTDEEVQDAVDAMLRR